MDAHDQAYFDSYGPHPYGHPYWMQFFDYIAREIFRAYCPQYAMDIGCAFGYLVERLRVRGIEAWGIDTSEYALSQATDKVRKFLDLASGADPLPRRYDLITCIEVVEHMPPEMALATIENICTHADSVLFSSTPDDIYTETHINVQPADHWMTTFAKYGMKPGRIAGFLAPHALWFER